VASKAMVAAMVAVGVTAMAPSLFCVMEKVGGNAYEDVRVEKDSFLGPRAVFRNAFMADIMSVGTNLERDDLC
jgi:hypothetical protein